MGLTTKEIGSSSFNDMISSVDRRSEYVENRANANVTLNNFLTPYTLDNKSSILNAPCGYSNGTYASLRPSTNTNLNVSFDSVNGWSWDGSVLSASPSTGLTFFNDDRFKRKKTYLIKFKVLSYTSGSLGYKWGGGSTFGNYFNDDLIEGNIISFQAKSDSTIGNFQFFSNNFNGSLSEISFTELDTADFDFSRGSSATRVNEKGLIEDVQILSGELVQNGDFEEIGSELFNNNSINNRDDGVNTINSDGTITTELNSSSIGWSVNASSYLNQNKIYKVEWKVISTNSSTGAFHYWNGVEEEDFGDLTQVGSGVYYVKGNSSGSLADFRFNGAQHNSTITWSLSVKEVGQNWTLTSGAFFTENGIKLTHTPTAGVLSTTYTPLVSGKKYRMTYEITENNDGGIKLNSATINTLVSTVGVHTKEFISNQGYLSIARTDPDGNDVTIDNISVIEITDDTDIPRIDYTSGQGALLLEPQRQNTATYSNDFTQGNIFNSSSDPSLSNGVVTSNQATSPKGQNDAWLFKDDNSGGNAAVSLSYFSSSVNSNDNNIVSVFVKKALSNNFFILLTVGFDVSANGISYFNIEDGTLGTISENHTAKIEDYGNGWYRCSVSFKATTDTVGAVRFRLATEDDNLNVTLDGTNGVYLFGLQCEASATQNYATSYIPTEGSTVTRNADVAINSGNADLFNDSEGVLYAEISGFVNGSGGDRTISISDGSTQNALQLLLHNTANRINFRLRSGGSLDVNISDFTFEQNEINKIACKYKSGDYALWINGEEKATSTSSSLPSGLSELAFDDGAFNDFYGNVKSLAVFKEALTDAELAQITSATQQEVFYQMRDRMNIKNYDYYEFGDYTTRLKKLF